MSVNLSGIVSNNCSIEHPDVVDAVSCLMMLVHTCMMLFVFYSLKCGCPSEVPGEADMILGI